MMTITIRAFFLPSILILLLLTAFACKKTEESIPDLLIPESFTFEEGNSQNLILKIPVTLSTPGSSDIVLRYSTGDGTASQGEDYTMVEEGQLTIAAGATEAFLELTILSDTIYETEEYFFVIVNGLTNAKLTQSQIKVIIEDNDPFIPVINFFDRYFFQEGNSGNTTASIPVQLSGPSEHSVSVKWSTIDKTAQNQQDYAASVNQVLTFAPGETLKNIQVSLFADDIFEMDDLFEIHFSDPQMATLTENTIKVFILNDDNYLPSSDNEGVITPLEYPLFELIWNDEFSGDNINTQNWGYNTGAGGWGNNELQTYTTSSQNSFVQDGKLHIKATKLYDNYFSARLLTQGKQEFLYGRIDIRAKMPYGQGIWPALWMLGANFQQVGWPRCGEIDIMEYLGHEQSKVHGSIHYFNSGHRSKTAHYALSGGQSFHDEFHVFTLVWQENSIRWYVDYQLFSEVKDTEIAFEAFTKPQFFIFNLAVGGNWPGYPNATTVFPQEMVVDYVRVFQSTPLK